MREGNRVYTAALAVLVHLSCAQVASRACQPVINVPPADRLLCTGSNGVFTCVATGADLVFSWQVDQGLGFVAVTNGGVHAGALTPTLTVSGAATNLNRFHYRCLVTNTCGAVTSSTATLWVSDPPAAACTPTTGNLGNYGTGINRVQLGAIDHAHTANDNDGWSDFSCQAVAVLAAGSTNLITITLDGSNPEYCQVYIDYDQNGMFSTNELVLNAPSGSGPHAGQVVIPVFPPVADQLLRMRVLSDYFAPGGPCADVAYGEIEDYGVFIPAGSCGPPVVTASPVSTRACVGGAATFACTATGSGPAYRWQADWGAGFMDVADGGVYTGATTATLSLSGLPASLSGYRFRCVVTNACGLAATEPASLAVGTPAATCAPVTINTGNFGTGIVRFQFGAIDHSHDDFDNDGTRDFTCSANTEVQTDMTYPFTVTLSGGNPEYCRIYIDFNDDGVYAAGEMVYSNNTTRQTVHSGTIHIPAAPAQPNRLLRLRVISDFATIGGGCDNVLYGEIEDYGVWIRGPSGQRALALTALTATNLLAYTAGPNPPAAAEYTTNLTDAAAWQVLPGAATIWSNGTNITTFSLPAGVPAAVLRFP